MIKMSENIKELGEALPVGLTRVIRKLKRRGNDGKTQEYEQAFHVKKASPGDRYAAKKELETPALSNAAQPVSAAPQAVDAAPPSDDTSPLSQVAPPPQRMSVKVLDIPWTLGDGREPGDPIPAEVRKRFDKNNRAARSTNPLSIYIPANTVTAPDQMLWGVVERELVARLGTGRFTKFRVGGSHNGCMLVKIESGDGYIHQGLLKIEALTDPYAYEVWGDLYDSNPAEGGFSRRAAASYEIAKAIGFDDILPPTVLRHDQYGDFDPIMSDELIERKKRFNESISAAVGDTPVSIRKHLNGFASVQFCPQGFHSIDGENWFYEFFSQDGHDEGADKLNRIFEFMPEGRRMSLIRTAVLDFILWTGDRTLGSIGWADEIATRHGIILTDNDLSLPNPYALSILRPKYGVDYLSPPVEPNAFPLLWSEPVMMVAARGFEKELRDYEEVAVEMVRRARGEVSGELARTLMEHQIPLLDIAGMFIRIEMLWTHHQKIARNPFLALDLYYEMASSDADSPPGPLEVEFAGAIDSVDEIMSKATGRDFDLVTRMREGE